MFVAAPILARKGGELVKLLISLIVSITAGVIANYICKWLD